jgi:hypothetical protein
VLVDSAKDAFVLPQEMLPEFPTTRSQFLLPLERSNILAFFEGDISAAGAMRE